MENFSELAKMRRSMRKFTEQELDQTQVETLLKSALMAPTSKGSHCWQFVVVDDKQLLKELAHCKARGAEFLEGAPLAVVVCADPSVSDVWIEDASVATTYLLLQAEDLGLGACWIQVRERCMEDGKPAVEMVRNILHIPSTIEVLSIVALGHKGMERKPFNEDRLLWENVHVNTYQAGE